MEEYKEKIMDALVNCEDVLTVYDDCMKIAEGYGKEAVEWCTRITTETDMRELARLFGILKE